MAMAWIKEIHNYSSNGTLKLQCRDNGRHPKIDRCEYGKDDWITFGPGESALPENFAVPWSYGHDQYLVVEATVDGKTTYMTVEVQGFEAWDYMVFRDKEQREEKKAEIGSQGDAPGINHSWWTLALHSDNTVQFVLLERQGLSKESAETFGKITVELLGDTIKAIGSVAGAAAAAAG